MPKIEKKQLVVNEIKEKLQKAASAVLVDGRGLTVEQDTALRKNLREAGVDYKVYKNALLNFAVKDTSFEGLSAYLKGPTTLVVSYDDPVAGARVIIKEMKTIPALEFKAGVIENAVYDGNGVKTIASIPSKDELLSKLLGSFKSPLATFARLVNAAAEKQSESA
ncbi:MAG: 50S ribosomal protein L10 [Clostridiales bacterium]|jgi:large subunit ribosomal protein L10|nr:50S ribosomal protein L10 [Clostridiales bacterium]